MCDFVAYVHGCCGVCAWLTWLPCAFSLPSAQGRFRLRAWLLQPHFSVASASVLGCYILLATQIMVGTINNISRFAISWWNGMEWFSCWFWDNRCAISHKRPYKCINQRSTPLCPLMLWNWTECKLFPFQNNIPKLSCTLHTTPITWLSFSQAGQF